MNTAVNAVVQIEPFKLFHSINEGVCSFTESSPSISPNTATVCSLPGRSTKPAGISQLGYACFWPNGGGLKDNNPFSDIPQQSSWTDGDDNMVPFENDGSTDNGCDGDEG